MKLGIGYLMGAATFAGFISTMLAMAPARADELNLKDGTKITGTIVGFEGNSFKVKTNYGSAIVQKDQVVSISISPVAKPEDSGKKTEPAAEKAAAASAPVKPAKPEPAVASAPANPMAPVSAPAVAPSIRRNDSALTNSAGKNAVALAAKPAPAPVAANAPPALPANASSISPVPAEPPKPAAPVPIRESVNGNTYTNETYGFQMYKPPDWEVIASASSLMPGAIAAMGTGDQTTYLLIGQAPAGKTLASDEDAADRRLRDIMGNYRPLELQHVTVSGLAAVERKFRGSVDEHDWSGVVVLVPRGGQLYTIFGMTVADTDLVQIQENVIARAISSLQFTKQ